ncbi:MAG: isoprenylcysteine carboxylmethyltransferase family protein [Methanobrevibacter thaueri]|nr:isoprenylcysteine carboxylmethyltransferase family protein [Methanobrevibacter thaueri]
MTKKENHLPLYGIGPYLVFPILITAIISLILTTQNLIPIYKINSLNLLLTILGIIIIIYGAVFLIGSFKSSIQDKIKTNTLQTKGIYAIIRHPIYASYLYISTGIILISNNIYLFILPVIYWIFLTVVLKNTEEKWLIELYGDEYIEYSKKVNRFLPRLIK